MNKREYLAQLERELKRNHVPDAGEILNEYAQHFAFKLADGYSEEEISARLGEPAALAAQFDGPSAPPKAGNKPLAAFGLCFVDLLSVCLFLTLLAWSLAMGAAALSSPGLASVGLGCAGLLSCLGGRGRPSFFSGPLASALGCSTPSPLLAPPLRRPPRCRRRGLPSPLPGAPIFSRMGASSSCVSI